MAKGQIGGKENINPKGGEGGWGIKVSHRSGDWLQFLTGSCYGHKNS